MAHDGFNENALLGAAILLGNFALFALSPWRPSVVRGAVAPGDPNTMFGALFFFYWGAIMAAVWRYEERWALFRILNARRFAPFVAVCFLGMAIFLLLVYISG